MATRVVRIVELGDEPPKEGEKGRAVAVDEAEEPAKLKKPRPDSAFEDVWPAPFRRRAGAAVRVPLGDSTADSKTDGVHRLAGGLFPRVNAAGRRRERSSMRGAPSPSRSPRPAPRCVAAELVRSGMSDHASRWLGPSFARELMLAHGSQQGFAANIGRMRYAASTLGPSTVSLPRSTVGDSGFALAAFGGLLPEPLSGAPAVRNVSASRRTRRWTPHAPRSGARGAGISTFGGSSTSDASAASSASSGACAIRRPFRGQQLRGGQSV